MQILIIGLGQFGMSLAKTLSKKKVEVIAVDINKELVDEAATFLDDALCLDATDEVSIKKLCPQDRDVVICSIRAREASILTTALLNQMGCKNIIARATNKIHERILKAIGATKVINPDEEYGKKFANKIFFQDIIADETSEDIELLEINILPFMVGKNLIDLALSNKYGIIVAAIKRGNKIIRPIPDKILEAEDRLLLVSSEESLAKMIEGNS